jgi:hypothetical protein
VAPDPRGFVLHSYPGLIVAGPLVNAAGAFASWVGAMLGYAVPVFGAPSQMIVTKAVAPMVNRLVAHGNRHLALKQAANGNVIIGAGWTAALDPAHHRPRPLRESLECNARVAQRVVPPLRCLHMLQSWAAMNINIDGAPILGELPRSARLLQHRLLERHSRPDPRPGHGRPDPGRRDRLQQRPVRHPVLRSNVTRKLNPRFCRGNIASSYSESYRPRPAS